MRLKCRERSTTWGVSMKPSSMVAARGCSSNSTYLGSLRAWKSASDPVTDSPGLDESGRSWSRTPIDSRRASPSSRVMAPILPFWPQLTISVHFPAGGLQVHLLVLDAAPQPFHEDVVHAPAPEPSRCRKSLLNPGRSLRQQHAGDISSSLVNRLPLAASG